MTLRLGPSIAPRWGLGLAELGLAVHVDDFGAEPGADADVNGDAFRDAVEALVARMEREGSRSGVLRFSAGIYDFDSPLAIGRDGVWMQGRSTVLRWRPPALPSLAWPAVVVGSATRVVTGCGISGVEIRSIDLRSTSTGLLLLNVSGFRAEVLSLCGFGVGVDLAATVVGGGEDVELHFVRMLDNLLGARARAVRPGLVIEDGGCFDPDEPPAAIPDFPELRGIYLHGGRWTWSEDAVRTWGARAGAHVRVEGQATGVRITGGLFQGGPGVGVALGSPEAEGNVRDVHLLGCWFDAAVNQPWACLTSLAARVTIEGSELCQGDPTKLAILVTVAGSTGGHLLVGTRVEGAVSDAGEWVTDATAYGEDR